VAASLKVNKHLTSILTIATVVYPLP